jgi:hypothetical protein
MSFTGTPENYLWLCSAIAHVIVLLRLIRSNLARIYRVFSIYLFAYAFRFAVYLFLPPGLESYSEFFVDSQPVMWIFEASVLIELCSLIFRNHAGLARVGGWLIGVGLSAFAISAAITAPRISAIIDWRDPQKVLFNYLKIERVLDAGMVGFLVAMTVVLCWFPFTLNRNILVYFAGWALYFLVRSAAIIVPFATGHLIERGVNIAFELAELLCVLTWLLFINKKGESAEKVSGYQWEPEHREQVRAQLEAVNTFLVKSRKS